MEVHHYCRKDAIKAEALECQTIDADCNDCRHFQRGEVVRVWLNCMENGKVGMLRFHTGLIRGTCLKFNRPTEAYPNKWTGRECFEHRRAQISP